MVTIDRGDAAVGALGELLGLLDPQTRRAELDEGAFWFEVPNRGHLALFRADEDGQWESDAEGLGMGLNGWCHATLEGLAGMLSGLVMGHITTLYQAALVVMDSTPT